ncbi:serologically defined colon cancer antigen 8 homolog isoform X2 [Cylas formicarius]|uniref:serologically defined colon cancer antigen 8 homolog isoform X2 n=1 Tax=Cylas formicarius TaxID=197179 RepID=UPI00295860FD|nr:serologically defined colon cancer antigen 8 homolog isoform X2 [Cylas formicarius]
MYSSLQGGVGKRQKTSASFLARPKLASLRSLFPNRPTSTYAPDKRKKFKKSYPVKMEFRKKPDYADIAYHEAVGRLRILLAESYTPPIRRFYGRAMRELDSAGEETDNQSLLSGVSRVSRQGRYYAGYQYSSTTPRRYHYPIAKSAGTFVPSEQHEKTQTDIPKLETGPPPPELMSFIERQEDYIEQLEKESRFCKDELSSLLTKVKEVISENENLHERQKSRLIKSVFDHLETETETETELDGTKAGTKSRKARPLEGPSIVYESRISELEAQLTQAKIDLKKALEEVDSVRENANKVSPNEDYKRHLDACSREKSELRDKAKELQALLSRLKDKENDTCDQVKRSLDVAEQAQYEKSAAELEIRRLKDELERQHLKLRDAIADQNRRVADERASAERRYTQQIEQLTTELGVQWESANKLQLELDKQRRENGDLRREVAQKQALIDELKKDMQMTLQSDIGVSGAEKSALEQQIGALQMANERTERQYKQEIARLQAEIQSLRQRLDRADADLIHSRREGIRLSEQVASLEKELNLNAALAEERSKSATPRTSEAMALPLPAKKDDREKELTSMIHDMETKHAATVAELEDLVRSQNQLMDKLSSECRVLTRKLDDASVRHKEEIQQLQTSLECLNDKFCQSQLSTSSVTGGNDPVKVEPSAQPKTQDEIKQPDMQFDRSPLPGNEQDPQTLTQQHVDGHQYPDPTQYDPNAEYQGYDPNMQYGDNSQYQYDPNMQYDPNQYEEMYDPNQQYSDQQYTEENAKETEQQISEQMIDDKVPVSEQ